MNRPDDEIKAAVAELVAEKSLDHGAHPSADELTAYYRGQMSAAEEARIQNHLLACPEDTSLLLDLERLESGELGNEHPASEIEIAAAWRATRSALPPAAAPPRRTTWLYAAAAMLSFAVLGQALWLYSLRQTVAELSRPQLNVKFFDLVPGTLRSGGGDSHVLEPGDRSFVLILHLPRDPQEPVDQEYDLDCRGADGESVWSATGMRRNVFGTLSLGVPRPMIAAGDYRLQLYRAGEPRGQPVAEYPWRVELVSEGG